MCVLLQMWPHGGQVGPTRRALGVGRRASLDRAVRASPGHAALAAVLTLVGLVVTQGATPWLVVFVGWHLPPRGLPRVEVEAMPIPGPVDHVDPILGVFGTYLEEGFVR